MVLDFYIRISQCTPEQLRIHDPPASEHAGITDIVRSELVSFCFLFFGVSLQQHLARSQKAKGGNQAEAEAVTGASKQDPGEANVLKGRILPTS